VLASVVLNDVNEGSEGVEGYGAEGSRASGCGPSPCWAGR